jgi:pSer/pThr/pTyr-binding forkhead associated (FHA) protein
MLSHSPEVDSESFIVTYNFLYPSEFQAFLSSVNLPEYDSCLKTLTVSDLRTMTDDKLKELGIPIRLHRLKILESLKCLSLDTSQDCTETDISEFNSQSTAELFDFSENCDEKISFKAISGYLEGVIYMIGEKGAKIGRTSCMEIVIPDSFVSRKHCAIQYDKKSNEFLLYDTGSTTGTYLMVRNEYSLSVGTMFQVGQCEFKVLNITYSLFGNPVSLELIKYEGPNPMPLIITTGGIIGRSASCQVSIPQDTLMSSFHAEIFIKKNSFYIKDINSTNNTWIRLSPEGEFSDGHSLTAGDLVKIGMVIFLVEPSTKKLSSPEKVCKNCRFRENTCEILPCTHPACLECASRLLTCYQCNKTIKEIVRYN